MTERPDWLAPLVELVEREPAPLLSGWGNPQGDSPRPAAVLMLFGAGAAGPDVLLLERSHDMRSHAGQVAFPGGSEDPEDESPTAAALREAQEETGVDPAGVEVLGELPSLWLPPTNFQVTPVLAWWREPNEVSAVDPAETASVHRVPVAELVDAANRVTVRHPSGFLGPGFLVQGLVVWGFTAGMLATMIDLVGWAMPWDKSRVVDLADALVTSSLRDLARAEFDR
jgi:8-oxo-dGTP pyrophosphatase MutT (NUDIX family)